MCAAFKDFTLMTMGKRVVTCAQAKARKIVLPTAILLRLAKNGCEIFGAEYMKVRKAVTPSQNQWSMSLKLNQTDPSTPRIKSMRWIVLLVIFQRSFSETFV